MAQLTSSQTPIESFSVSVRTADDSPCVEGEITLTDSVVAFRSAQKVVPWAGRHVKRKVRAWMSEVRWDAATELATLVFRDECWLCTGPDARALAFALDATLTTHRPTLVAGRARLVIGSAEPVEGVVQLDTDRLRFIPDGTETPSLDTPWSTIDADRLVGIRPTLHAEVAGRSVQISGAEASALSAWLTTLRAHVAAGHETSSLLPSLDRCPTKRLHGPLALQGQLVVSPNHVQFVPSGLLERTLGLRDVALPFSSLERIKVHGWAHKRLTLIAGAHQASFSFDDVGARFEQLLQAVHQGQANGLANRARTRARIDQVLERWSGVFDRSTERIAEAQLVVQVRGQHDATVGVLVKSTDVVQFLPCSGPEGAARAELHPVPRILRTYSGPGARAYEICFSVAGTAYRYLPAEGAAFVTRFWDQCRAPSRIFHLDAPSRRALSRILGPSQFIRTRIDGRPALSLRSIQENGRTWSTVFAPGAELPAIGTFLHTDVGQPEGVYRFESPVVDINPTTNEVHFARPDTVRVYNQRQTVRVPVDLAATVRMSGLKAVAAPIAVEDSLLGPQNDAPRPQSLQLSDLSLGGCAAEGAADLPLGASVEMEVAVHNASPIRVTGRVLRADPVDGGELRRFGIRFENIQRKEEVRLQRHVLTAQRTQLAGLESMVG